MVGMTLIRPLNKGNVHFRSNAPDFNKV